MSKKLKALAAVGAAAVAMSVVMTTQAQGATTLVVSTDLPLQGGSKDQSDTTNEAVALLIKQAGGKAGKYNITLKKYDDSTAAKGSWDDAQCAKNAQAHVANRNEVAVMGTYNSGCAKIIVPVLNQDPKGPMLMVSNANTNPGLTKPWNAGEPEKYYPTGKRNYFRVVTTDDNQGSAAANFAKSEGVKKVYVLNDRQTYGQGVAQAFTTEAKKIGLTVLSDGPAGEGWDDKQPNYEALFTKIKALSPDMIYIGGIFDLNGGQLVKDKVKILGDNKTVKLMAPDGFTGYPDFLALKESDGAYLSFTGLAIDFFPKSGAAAKFLADYKKEYKHEPTGAFSIYGAAAMQVILDAISRSNGTRADVFKKAASTKISAAKSVVGKAISFDANGDTMNRDITIEIVKGGAEVGLKVITVK
ncbi:MAG: amino acid ABC transporter substrate-binding protein [Actinobacteria bacterium]|jgi:branched-chain amino acid transport system substrate-binding protein|nr:amino acid ABC transporter substrate-binding protein [Actinomycetota bacterium]